MFPLKCVSQKEKGFEILVHLVYNGAEIIQHHNDMRKKDGQGYGIIREMAGDGVFREGK